MIQQTKRSYIQLILLLVILCSIAQAHRPIFSEKSESKVIHVEIRDGIRIHTVETEYQNSKQEIRVLLPDRYRKGKHYRVLYVLPVEKGFDQSYGYGLGVLKQMDAHNNHDLIIVQMGFEKEPWYGDHATNPKIRQASYLKEFVVPFVEKQYSTMRKPEGRLLLGFSKSGWGAFSLILTYPEFFGYAASWDAPMFFGKFHYKMEPVYGTLDQLNVYRPDLLASKQKVFFQKKSRLVLMGEKGWGKSIPAPSGGSHTIEMHELLDREGINHIYNNNLKVPHRWHEQWMAPTLEALMTLAHHEDPSMTHRADPLNSQLRNLKIDRIWLTYKSSTPDKIVVNWETEIPGNSTVRYQSGHNHEDTISIEEEVTLHHVEIPIEKRGIVLRYSVHTGSLSSDVHAFKGIPVSELRVAVVANWQRKPTLDAILRDDVHLLLTAGDNISNTWQKGGVGQKGITKFYSDLIDAYPALFRSIPFMPVLGNHDKEFRPRGNKPPDHPVYDIEATGFRTFFELPNEEWKWHFDVPEFDIRFIALDLNHISDMGTTWQACHSFSRGSTQYEWYKFLIESSKQQFIVTLYNEKNSSVRRQEDLAWQSMLEHGTICISGFGYFAEKAIRGDFVYYNTSLSGTGDKYPDPNSVLLVGEDNYILIRLIVKPNRMVVEMKNLEGKTLDKMTFD